jgi:acyl-coenzyme A synthetase/AMP-(fatty) acid ligase/acyl carrier protein
VTVLNQTPSAFAPLLQIAEFLDPKQLSSLRLVIFGGEALNLQSLRPWFEQRGDSPVQLVNMYGITETTVHVTYRPIKEADLDGSGSLIGAPLPDLQVYLLDQKMQPVPIGVPGEIFVGGAGLSQGYLNRPDLSAERFVPNLFNAQAGERLYRSGDLARYLSNGELEYLGRRDHQVKMRGFRIELGEIEASLNEYPGVRQAVVLLRQDWEETSSQKSSQLVAYLVAETELPIEKLRNYLKVRLPEYMLPGAFVFLPELPLTSNGKVDRNALPKPAAQGFLNEQDYLTPLTAFEQILSRLWAEALNIERVGLKDNFFQLGGHSLLAIRIIYRIEDLFDMKLELQTLFDNPIFEDFARLILENSPERERVEQVAELLIELADLSDEDAKRILSGQAKT